MREKQTIRYLIYVLFFILVSIPLFWDLGKPIVRNWDESRNVFNSYEMFKNGNWLVTYFKGQPEMWNSKPPLLNWLQVISMKIFGVNEFAWRFPSALAGLLTCISIFVFIKKYLKSDFFAYASVLFLITSIGFVKFHVTRTGDFDSVLVLFTSTSALFLFSHLSSKRPIFLYLFFITTTFAVLTKGVAGLLFTPAYCLYVLISGNLISLLKNKHFYLGLVIFLFFGIGYYPLRELLNPGYLSAVFENELGGRMSESLDNSGGPFSYYFNQIYQLTLNKFIFLAFWGIILGFLAQDKKVKSLTIYLTLIITTFLLIISVAETKHDWYDAPVYPFLSILCGITLYLGSLIFKLYLPKLLSITNFPITLPSLKVYYAVALFLVIFSHPYYTMVKSWIYIEEYPWLRKNYKIAYFMRDVYNNKIENQSISDSYIVLTKTSGVRQPIEVYQRILKDKGVNIQMKEKEKLMPGDIIFAYQDDAKNYLKENYEYKVITEYKDNINYMHLKKYEILRKK